jgi:hypothetical protein
VVDLAEHVLSVDDVIENEDGKPGAHNAQDDHVQHPYHVRDLGMVLDDAQSGGTAHDQDECIQESAGEIQEIGDDRMMQMVLFNGLPAQERHLRDGRYQFANEECVDHGEEQDDPEDP